MKTIGTGFHSLQDLFKLVRSGESIELSEDVKHRVQHCREVLDEMIKEADAPIYGINTGFGSNHNESISSDQLEQLQVNLVKSHACGMGEIVPEPIVKWMLLLKILGLGKGHSGVQLQTLERLQDFYNQEVFPEIFQQGSLGASGDLSPLAHMSLALIGEGKVKHDGQWKSTHEVMGHFKWNAIPLRSKEGLALLNGTQFMSGYGCYLLEKCQKLFSWANHIGAMSLEAFNGRSNPFAANVNEIRKQEGQIYVAKVIRELLEGSELQKQEKTDVQDPYSFRCMPQVHGATKDVLDYAFAIFEREVNAVTDNPTIFPETREVISAGNFHGQPLALTLDQLSIAMAELGSISERRIYKLIGGERGLKKYLVKNPGLDSGFMIPQYTAASIVSQNKQLCMPASVDTIDSSLGQEDHVSMGANAATKAYRVIENVEKVLAIELMNASQALQFRTAKPSRKLQKIQEEYVKVVPFLENDDMMSPRMHRSIQFLRERRDLLEG